MADVLTTAKQLIFYFEFFKQHHKFDYKALVYDIHDLFQEFLSYFPRLLQSKCISIENQEKFTKNDDGVVLSLISNIYDKKPSSSHTRRLKMRSIDSLNYSQSSLFNAFLRIEDIRIDKSPQHFETKSTIINLKSRKITLNEEEINRICHVYKKTEKNKHFRILPENFNSEDFSLEKSSLQLEKMKNNDKFLDKELFESIFKSKTVFHKQISSHTSIADEISQKESLLPRLVSNKNGREEKKKELQTKILLPMKAESFKYMKPIPDLKSYKNLQNTAKDFLSRFIIKK